MIRVLLLLCLVCVSAAAIELTSPELAGINIGSVTVVAGISVFALLCYVVYCFHFSRNKSLGSKIMVTRV
jgi:hypothetical protein